MHDEFLGATMVLTFPTTEKLEEAVFILMDDEHDHNFKVAKSGKRLYASTTAMGCLVHIATQKAYHIDAE